METKVTIEAVREGNPYQCKDSFRVSRDVHLMQEVMKLNYYVGRLFGFWRRLKPQDSPCKGR